MIRAIRPFDIAQGGLSPSNGRGQFCLGVSYSAFLGQPDGGGEDGQAEEQAGEVGGFAVEEPVLTGGVS